MAKWAKYGMTIRQAIQVTVIDRPGDPAVNKMATVKLAPTAALAADDVQTITLMGVNDQPDDGIKRIRAVRRVVKPGADPISFDMPTGYGSVSWTLDDGRISINDAPAISFTKLSVTTSGAAVDGKPLTETLVVSPAYAAATGLARMILDTSIDGFKADWKLDVNAGYSSVLTQSTTTKSGDVTIATSTHNVAPK